MSKILGIIVGVIIALAVFGVVFIAFMAMPADVDSRDAIPPSNPHPTLCANPPLLPT